MKLDSPLYHLLTNFLRQYQLLYPTRKPLPLLLPLSSTISDLDVNFISTYIYPSISHPSLITLASTLQFLSDTLQYLPLTSRQITDGPSSIKDLNEVWAAGTANCLEMAVILSGWLEGGGYDSYVCWGYAGRERCLGIRETDLATFDVHTFRSPKSHLKSDCNFMGVTVVTPPIEQKELKYKVKSKKVLRSKFLHEQEQRLKLQEKSITADLRDDIVDNSLESEEDDLRGLRVHIWILVKAGKRDISEDLFIEPSTGTIYSTNDDQYLGLESAFNSKNCWVNMQVCYTGVKDISLDLNDTMKWEVVLSTSIANTMEEEEDIKDDLLISPCLPAIRVSQERFENRYPNSGKRINYRNASVLLFAPHQHISGLIHLTTYNYLDLNSDLQVSVFQNRKDRLLYRVTSPSLRHEYFGPGRADGVKEFIESKGEVVTFYFDETRSDGLKCRKENERKIEWWFDSEVIYRSTTFELLDSLPDLALEIVPDLKELVPVVPTQQIPPPFLEEPNPKEIKIDELPTTLDESLEQKFNTLELSELIIEPVLETLSLNVPTLPEVRDLTPANSLGEALNLKLRGIMVKMTEKFAPNSLTAKITYFVRDERIRVTSHLLKDKIIPSVIEFHKPSLTPFETLSAYNADIYAKVGKPHQQFEQLLGLIQTEIAFHSLVKMYEREMRDYIQIRVVEERESNLVISIYDTLRNSHIPTHTHVSESKNLDKPLQVIDYLSPFFVNYVKKLLIAG